jgi:hypothetical protein
MDPGADGSENSGLKDGRALASSSGAFLFSSTGIHGYRNADPSVSPSSDMSSLPF